MTHFEEVDLTPAELNILAPLVELAKSYMARVAAGELRPPGIPEDLSNRLNAAVAAILEARGLEGRQAQWGSDGSTVKVHVRRT